MARPRPRVSVIMAVHNCEDYVGEAIESIQAQTCEDWELLCVDDASTDDSAAIVERYAADDSRISVIRQENNRGPAGTRNTALAEARGDFIAILDSDDIAPSWRLERSLQAFAEDPKLGIIGGNYEIIGPSGNVVAKVEHEELVDEEFKQCLQRHLMPVPHSSCMIRRELLENIGGYDERLAASEDFDMVLRLSPNCHCRRISEILTKYRHRPGQHTERDCFAQSLYAHFAFRRMQALREDTEFNEEKELVKIRRRVAGWHGFSQVTAMRLRALALRSVQGSDHSRFRELIGRSLRYWPFSAKGWLLGVLSLTPTSVQKRCVQLLSRLQNPSAQRS